MSRRAPTLLRRTGLTMAAGLLLYSLFALLVTRWLIIQPVTERAAEELAAFLELTAKVWVELPPWTRDDYNKELTSQHSLQVGNAGQLLEPAAEQRDYLDYLARALERRVGEPINVHVDPERSGWYWVVLPAGGRHIPLGFDGGRLEDHVPVALVLILAVGGLLVLLVSLLLVRSLTRPLADLSRAIRRLGRGEEFQPLPVDGPVELAELASRINRTEQQVRELLENRTTLLAGVSHDLRTPIARMQLALELLGEEVDQSLVDGMRHDLEDMDHLIGRALELARGLDTPEAPDVDPAALLRSLADDYARGGAQLQLELPPQCDRLVPGDALRRVLGNLLDNALRYAGDSPITLRLHCSTEYDLVEVVDHGPGIPPEAREAVRRPFHRVEASRARDTGGSGLGLAIVDQLCAAYSWELQLGDTPGGGLTVGIRIPSGPAGDL